MLLFEIQWPFVAFNGIRLKYCDFQTGYIAVQCIESVIANVHRSNLFIKYIFHRSKWNISNFNNGIDKNTNTHSAERENFKSVFTSN